MKRHYCFLFFALVLCLCFNVTGSKVSAQPAPATLMKYISPASYLPTFDTAGIYTTINTGNELIWSNPDSAMKLFTQAEHESRTKGYIKGAVEALLSMAHAYASKTKYTESFSYYNRALSYSRYVPNKSIEARIYTDMATTYLLQSDYVHAANYYLASINVLKKNGLAETKNILFTYANLAYLQIRLQQYKLALFYLNEAERIARKKEFHGALGFILNNEGEAYRSLKQLDKALRCNLEGLEQIHKSKLPINQKKEIQQALYISLGSLMISRHEPQKAVNYLNEALHISNATNPYFSSIFPNYMLGEAYYNLKYYAKAEKYLLPALQKATKLKFTEDMPEALKVLSAVYEATGRDSAALQQYKAYAQLQDSIMGQEKMQEVNALEIKYKTIQKDKELADKQLLILSQHNQLMKKNTWLLIFSLSILILLIAVLLLIMRFRNNRHQRYLQEEKIKNIASEMERVKQEEEIKVIHALMKGEERERERLAKELHDGIGGMIAAIQMQVSTFANETVTSNKEQQIPKIIRLLEETATEIRETAHNLMPDIVLQQGIENALYLFCTNINASGAFRLDLQVHEGVGQLDKTTELNIYRIIQELVHNIVRHAGASNAIIQLTKREDMLYIIVEDDGYGFDPKHNKHGLGLQNIRSRVESPGGYFSIDSSPGKGTTCYIEIPLPT